MADVANPPPEDVKSSEDPPGQERPLDKATNLQFKLKEDHFKQDTVHGDLLAITDERRLRFNEILLNLSKYEFSPPKVSRLRYVIQEQTFHVEASLRHCKVDKNQPTLWYLETIMPGSPEQFGDYFGDSSHRSQWDQRIASYRRKELISDNQQKLTIVNNLTQAVLGGVISPRQFTSVVHSKRLSPDMIEAAGCSIKSAEFPKEKGFVLGHSALFGHRITKIPDQELRNKYEIPQLKVIRDQEDEFFGKDEILPWCKCQCMMQTDIKGWLPKSAVRKAMETGIPETFSICRQYILKDVCAMDFDIRRSSFGETLRRLSTSIRQM